MDERDKQESLKQSSHSKGCVLLLVLFFIAPLLLFVLFPLFLLSVQLMFESARISYVKVKTVDMELDGKRYQANFKDFTPEIQEHAYSFENRGHNARSDLHSESLKKFLVNGKIRVLDDRAKAEKIAEVLVTRLNQIDGWRIACHVGDETYQKHTYPEGADFQVFYWQGKDELGSVAALNRGGGFIEGACYYWELGTESNRYRYWGNTYVELLPIE
jgi:hypothetical protein